jgi:hypothetical protein
MKISYLLRYDAMYYYRGSTRIYGVTSWNITVFISTAVDTSNAAFTDFNDQESNSTPLHCLSLVTPGAIVNRLGVSVVD